MYKRQLLYYTKNAENLRSTMMEEVFGCTTPLSAGTQRDSFNALVEETLGDDCAYDTVLETVSYTHLYTGNSGKIGSAHIFSQNFCAVSKVSAPSASMQTICAAHSFLPFSLSLIHI